MAIAPQVYNMRRGGGGFGRFLRGAAKGALAAGALAGAGALALATQEEMAKTGGEKKAKVTENLTDTGVSTETTPGGQKVTVNATDGGSPFVEIAPTSTRTKMTMPQPPSMTAERLAPIRERIDAFQRGVPGGSQVLTGDALDAAEAAVFDDPNVLVGGGPLQNRISGQTQVPQADPNTTFESRGAQIASTSEPTQPRVEVRQQPSSGAQVTDLSNVAATESAPSTVREKTNDFIGRVFGTREQAPSQLAPYAALNREEQEIRDLLTAYEAVEGQALAGQDQSISPFQVGGAMLSLREQNEPVRVMQKSMPGASNQEIVSAMYAPSDPGGVLMQLPSTSGKPASVRFYPENRGEGGISAAKVQYTPGGKTYTFETSPEGLARLQGIQSGAEKVKSGKSFLRDAVSKGQLANPVDTFFASLKAESAPVQTAASEKQSPFVTDKGREVGAVLNQAQEKKAAAPTLKEIAGDALNLLNPFKGKKIDPREEQIRRDVDRTLGRFTPEQKEAEVRRRLGQ